MEDEDARQPVSISNDGAAALIKILLERGYFHEGQPARNVVSKEYVPPTFPPDESTLIQTSSARFVTLDRLCEDFCRELQSAGRLNSAQAAQRLDVQETVVERILLHSAVRQNKSLLQQGNEILTSSYLDEKVRELTESLSTTLEGGTILIADVARSALQLPLETTLSVLEDRLPSHVTIRTLDSGCKVLVTSDYLQEYENTVLAAFGVLKEPVHLDAFCKKNDWQVSWVEDILQAAIDDKALNAELHGDCFIPNVFVQRQRQAILDAFSTNGFCTDKQAHLQQMSFSQMVHCIQQVYPTALVLNKSVVHPDIIVSPLESAIQETEGWLDLELHLPPELLQMEQDCKAIVFDHVLVSLGDAAGVAAVQSQGGLFFSRAMVTEATQSIVLPLLESSARQRAIELDKDAGAQDVLVDIMAKEEKRRSKKSAKSSKQSDLSAVDIGSLPSMEIASAIAAKYHGLSEHLPPDEDSEHDSVLLAICETAFLTKETDELFRKSVQAELKRLVAAREAKARTSRKETASKVQSIETAFEDPSCFAAACFMLQTMRKFITYASESGMKEHEIENLEEEFLEGCCADFTSRITQYCLFKNAVDSEQFSFHPDSNVDSAIYYGPVNTAIRRYPPTYFSCEPDEKLKIRDPLSLVRNLLPGTVGVALARQWILCGGKCYQGGTRQSDDGSGETYVRPGDVDGFLAHVQENCLTICQLPFKKLDKKSEKQFLFARRRHLVELLETEKDASIVLELTIMLLFQLVKNMVVSGSLLCGPILTLLCKERKISSNVAEELSSMSQKIKACEPIDLEQVERVRALGLSKK